MEKATTTPNTGSASSPPGQHAPRRAGVKDLRPLRGRPPADPGHQPVAAARPETAGEPKRTIRPGLTQPRSFRNDYLSIAPYQDPAPTHEVLLRAGVTIVETLDLRGVEPGPWQLICLPLLIPGADGAPARVLLSRD